MKKIILSIALFVLLWVWVIYAINTLTEGFKITHSWVKIEVYNDCKNAKVNSWPDVFVPTGSEDEWNAFKNNKPSSVELTDCTTCTVTSWTPSPSTVCSWTNFTQTSNCWTTRSATWTKSCTTSPICWDWVVQSPEQCDDGNTVSWDWCSSTCTNESSTSCRISSNVYSGPNINTRYEHPWTTERYRVHLTNADTILGWKFFQDNTLKYTGSSTVNYTYWAATNYLGYVRAYVKNSTTWKEVSCISPDAIKIVPVETCNISISNSNPSVGDTVTLTQTNNGFIDPLSSTTTYWEYCNKSNFACGPMDYYRIWNGLSQTFTFNSVWDYRFFLELESNPPYRTSTQTAQCWLNITVK